MTDKKPTVTGRITRTEPEPYLQLPSRVHRPGQPAPTLVEVDYSEIEKRVMAHYAVEADVPMPRKIGEHPALAPRSPCRTERSQNRTTSAFCASTASSRGAG